MAQPDSCSWSTANTQIEEKEEERERKKKKEEQEEEEEEEEEAEEEVENFVEAKKNLVTNCRRGKLISSHCFRSI